MNKMKPLRPSRVLNDNFIWFHRELLCLYQGRVEEERIVTSFESAWSWAGFDGERNSVALNLCRMDIPF